MYTLYIIQSIFGTNWTNKMNCLIFCLKFRHFIDRRFKLRNQFIFHQTISIHDFNYLLLLHIASEFPTFMKKKNSNNMQHAVHAFVNCVHYFQFSSHSWCMIKPCMCRNVTILFVNGRQILNAHQFKSHSQLEMVSNLNNKTRFHRKYNYQPKKSNRQHQKKMR